MSREIGQVKTKARDAVRDTEDEKIVGGTEKNTANTAVCYSNAEIKTASAISRPC